MVRITSVGLIRSPGSPSVVRRASPRLPWAVCLTALTLLAVTPPMAAVAMTSWWTVAAMAVGAAGAPLLGAMIAVRRPENVYGWLWLAFGIALAMLLLTSTYARAGISSLQLPAPDVAAILAGTAWIATFGLVPLLLLLFPDGRLPSVRWRFVLWAVISAATAAILAGPFLPGESGMAPINNPLGVGSPLGEALWGLVYIAVFVIFGSTLLAVTSLALRYRRAGGVERSQIQWLAYAAVVFGAMIVFSGLLGQELPGIWQELIVAFSFGALWLGVGIAVLRYRLYEIDLIVNRTLVYGVLTAIVVGLYVIVVTALNALLRDDRSVLASVLAAGVVAVAFSPVRERLQRGVNRLIYGERDEPYRVLTRLGRRLEATLPPDAALAAIVNDVARALRLRWVGLWITDGEAIRLAAAYGALPTATSVRDPSAVAVLRGAEDGLHTAALDPGAEYRSVLEGCGVGLVLPLAHRGDLVGALTVAPRRPAEDFTSADSRLLRDLASQAGAAVHAVRLTEALRTSLEDLRRSRELLLATQDEERRRIQRDLHDGLGPILASMRLRLEACLGSANLTRHEAAGDLERLYELVGQATAEIRRLVYDLRPPALDQLGLVPALHQHCDRVQRETGIQVRFAASDDVRVPVAAEVTVLRVAQEALLNVSKHANASRAEVSLSLVNGWICLAIRDDGEGFDASSEGASGTGIGSMTERAELLGGTMSLVSRRDRGTEVRLRLPVVEDEYGRAG